MNNDYTCLFCGQSPETLGVETDMIPIIISGKRKWCCRKCIAKLDKIYNESEVSNI